MPLIPKQQPPYYTATAASTIITLTDAEIKNLVGTPIQIVPAQGTNTIISLIKGELISDFTAGNYSNTTSHFFELAFLNGDTLTNSITCTHFDAVTKYATLNRSSENEAYDLINCLNKPIVILINGSGELADGNPANTLKVKAYYNIITL